MDSELDRSDQGGIRTLLCHLTKGGCANVTEIDVETEGNGISQSTVRPLQRQTFFMDGRRILSPNAHDIGAGMLASLIG